MSGERRDVAGATLAVPQRLAQGGDLNAQAALLDGDVGPDDGHQFALADGLVRAGNEGYQVSRARAPTTMGAPSFWSRRRLGSRLNGPNETTSLLPAAGSIMAHNNS